MLKIVYTKAFLSQYKKLTPAMKNKSRKAIDKFEKNPKNPSLATHKLHGPLSHLYSFSVDRKFRIVFEMDKKNGAFIFLKVGDHSVYS